MARAQGPELCPPGRREGRAVEHAARHAPGRRGGCPRNRARRACHDATVDRTTNGAGRIADLTWDQIQRLDNAHWWVPGQVVNHEANEDDYTLRGRAPDDGDLRIPLLSEVLATFPGTFLNLDIKETKPAVQPYEQLLADLLREHERTDDVIVASFSDEAIAAFGSAAPDISTAAATNATAAFYFAVMQGDDPPPTTHHALQIPREFGGIPVVTEPFVKAAHMHGLAVHVWTIDEEDEMRELLEIGVDGIMTDRPTALGEVLNKSGTAYRA